MDKFYDVFIKVTVDGYEKEVINRVSASSIEEVEFLALQAEVHAVDNATLEMRIAAFKKENKPIRIEDGNTFIYEITNIVELQQIKHDDFLFWIPVPSTALSYNHHYHIQAVK